MTTRWSLGRVSTLILSLAAVLASGTAARAQLFAYFHDRSFGTDQVVAYALDDDGAMTALAGSPFASGDAAGHCSGYCMTMASGKLGPDQYLFTSATAGVTVWKIAANGTPQVVAGSPFDGGLGAADFLGTATVRMGSRLFVYAVVFDLEVVAGFEVQDDGTLSPVADSPFPTGAGPIGLDAAGKVVLCAVGAGASSFVVQGDGSLVEADGSPFAIAGGPFNLQLDPKGAFVYVPEANANLHGLRVNQKTGVLTPVAGGPFDKGISGNCGSEVLAKKLVVTFDNGATAAGQPDFSVLLRAKDGSLTLLGKHISGFPDIAAHAMDLSGQHLVLIANDETGNNVSSYRFDAKTGEAILVDQEQVTVSFVNDAEVVQL